MDQCYVLHCGELAAGVCQWCAQPVCATHSICIDGPRFLYFYLCDKCNISGHYMILSSRIFHQGQQTNTNQISGNLL